MEFDKEHKVIISTLSIVEASAFIKFLQSEILRHQQDITDAAKLIMIVKEQFHV